METFTAGNTFAVAINDAQWSSPQARSKGLRRFALAHIGTRGLDEVEFSSRLAEQTIRQILPIALRKAGLEEAAARCATEGTKEAAVAAESAAEGASSAHAAAYAAGAAWNAMESARAWAAAAGGAAAREAACAACDARSAAWAAGDAAWTADSAGGPESDEVLTLSANIAAEILENMKAAKQLTKNPG